VQAALSIALLLAAASFKELLGISDLFRVAVLHDRCQYPNLRFPATAEPNAVRPYKTWGLSSGTRAVIVSAAVLLCYTFAENVRNSLMGTLVILAGVPIFLYFKKQEASDNDNLIGFAGPLRL